MAATCVPTNRCGTHATGWLNGVHPTVSEGIVTRQVCFNWSGGCCVWSINIQVRNCNGYFVYYISGTPSVHPCHLRYCGADQIVNEKKRGGAFIMWTPQIFDSFHPQGSFCGCEMKVVLVVIVLKLAENFFPRRNQDTKFLLHYSTRLRGKMLISRQIGE